jgi:hypothetical protein
MTRQLEGIHCLRASLSRLIWVILWSESVVSAEGQGAAIRDAEHRSGELPIGWMERCRRRSGIL